MTAPEPQASVAEQAAKALGITQLIPTIYQDLLQPVARETGERLVVVARAVGVALAPLEALIWGYDRIRDYLSAAVAVKLANKPPDEIQSPDPIIAGPAILNMAFAAEAPHLREMYATLLSRAMHSPSAPKVHPSFAQIIQQLSSIEAQVLQQIAKAHTEDILFYENLAGDGSNVVGDYISTQWRAFCGQCGVGDATIADVSYYNLIRLGILIERAEADSEYRSDRFDPAPLVVDTTTTRYVMLTAYGNLFLDICVRDL